MDNADSASIYLVALEDALVGEFRTYQTLLAATKEERRAICEGDLNGLQAVIAQKEALLGELSRLEGTRQTAAQKWAIAAGLDTEPLILSDMLPRLDPATAGRLDRLRQGVLALADDVRDLDRGNRTLAVSALERVEAVRDFLLSLCQTPVAYQPLGMTAPAAMNAALGVEHWA